MNYTTKINPKWESAPYEVQYYSNGQHIKQPWPRRYATYDDAAQQVNPICPLIKTHESGASGKYASAPEEGITITPVIIKR